jgi:hypothetical protein
VGNIRIKILDLRFMNGNKNLRPVRARARESREINSPASKGELNKGVKKRIKRGYRGKKA